jgi:hypothetical protein
MNPWILFVLVTGCASTVATSPLRKGEGRGSEYCPFILETVQTILGPFTDDYTTLEEGCVKEVASAGDITYAEAVGFEPMPLETITCQGHGWVAWIGQNPPRAPTPGVVLVGFEEPQRGVRKFSARVERRDWRAQPNRVAVNGCGAVEGTVERKGERWIAKTVPQKLGW